MNRYLPWLTAEPTKRGDSPNGYYWVQWCFYAIIHLYHGRIKMGKKEGMLEYFFFVGMFSACMTNHKVYLNLVPGFLIYKKRNIILWIKILDPALCTFWI